MTSTVMSAAMMPPVQKFTSRVRLTRKERELLAVLMQNAGRCVSRETLLRTVWKYGDGAKTRTVDVHVQRLRRKLGSETAASIKTIVRAGYCWLPDPEPIQ
ncbi:MAG: helix-turn-helix domain-containing protein [Bryobacteraceae bacterium]|nr:helix-turn-helix domain-containing protein [Bryobacteraceae bacterium]